MTKSGILFSKLKNYGWNSGQILASQAIAPIWLAGKGSGSHVHFSSPFGPFWGWHAAVDQK